MEPSRALYGAIFLRRGTGDADYIGLQQFRCFLRSFLGQPDGSFREEQGLYQRPAYKKEKPVEESGKKTKFSDLDSYDLQYRTKDNGDIEEVYIGYERVVGNQESETSYFLYSNGVDKELDLDGQTIQKSLYDSKNNQLVLLVADEEEAEVAVEGDRADSADDSDSTDRSDEKDEAGELMTVSLKGETAELVPYDEDVSFLELVYGGNIYYLKDVEKTGKEISTAIRNP